MGKEENLSIFNTEKVQKLSMCEKTVSKSPECHIHEFLTFITNLDARECKVPADSHI